MATSSTPSSSSKASIPSEFAEAARVQASRIADIEASSKSFSPKLHHRLLIDQYQVNIQNRLLRAIMEKSQFLPVTLL
uniref:Uncharacterized protein n=1 Tax=Oryza punctata TaxID=4537 RepID=A0A0E0LJT3_ORYPU